MCGRYALGIRATFVRHQLQNHNMPVYGAPDDDDVRQTYNFAPGNHGLVYRADVPDHGTRDPQQVDRDGNADEDLASQTSQAEEPKETRYKLQAMRWGLIPFWTKRNPDYGSMMRTINARDDSLAEDRGMWTTMKKKKRCIVVAQGFYEWLKKNGGKEKIPHYTKRKDGQLMCFAGLWDCVQYEGSEDKIYTYTIITTESNSQLSFLHDRMPVILDNGSDEIRTWLDPGRSEWTKELQSLLKPYQGELECYPVDQAVGKVGNNSPSFIIPVASTENKKNIANFFLNAKKREGKPIKQELKHEKSETIGRGTKVYQDETEQRQTADQDVADSNAPLPVLPSPIHGSEGVKRKHEAGTREDDNTCKPSKNKVVKVPRKAASVDDNDDATVKREVPTPATASPERKSGRKPKNARQNTAKGSPTQTDNGSQRITNYFNK